MKLLPDDDLIGEGDRPSPLFYKNKIKKRRSYEYDRLA